MKTSLKPGYHIIEKKLVEKNIEAKHMSIIEFLRKSSSRLPEEIVIVHGLEDAVRFWDNPDDFAKYLREKFKAISEQMMEKGYVVIIFVVRDNCIIGEDRPFLVISEDEPFSEKSRLNLARIFGADRLEKIRKGHFHSTFNIP